MAKRDQVEEMTQAANRFADAAERLSRSLDRFTEFWRYEWTESGQTRGERLPGELVLGLLGAGGLSDDETGELAHEAVHRVREELGREVEAKAPNPDEIARWWRNGGIESDESAF